MFFVQQLQKQQLVLSYETRRRLSATRDTRIQIDPGGHGREALRSFHSLAPIHPEHAKQTDVGYFVY